MTDPMVRLAAHVTKCREEGNQLAFASFETNSSRSLEPFRSERKRSVFGFVLEPKGNRVSCFAMAKLAQAVDSS